MRNIELFALIPVAEGREEDCVHGSQREQNLHSSGVGVVEEHYISP